MIINTENLDGYFYAKNPHIDGQRKLTFFSSNCTHYLIVSGDIGDDMDIRKNGVAEQIAKIDLLKNPGESLRVGKFWVRLVKQSTYIAVGHFIQVESKATCHAVYGCVAVESEPENKLQIYIPDKIEEAIACIPLTVTYKIRPHMTEEKRGFLGLGKKRTEFAGAYIVRIDHVQEYPDGCIYYTVGAYNYYITKEMLEKDIYIKADDSKAEPVLRSANRSISLVRV